MLLQFLESKVEDILNGKFSAKVTDELIQKDKGITINNNVMK